MMYPFMELDDNTQVVHSELRSDQAGESVRVYFEKPIEGGFQSASCYLPEYRWTDIEGFTENDISRYQEFLETTAHLIMRFAKQGGLGNAANL
jgi:hypothetical protein